MLHSIITPKRILIGTTQIFIILSTSWIPSFQTSINIQYLLQLLLLLGGKYTRSGGTKCEALKCFIWLRIMTFFNVYGEKKCEDIGVVFLTFVTWSSMTIFTNPFWPVSIGKKEA